VVRKDVRAADLETMQAGNAVVREMARRGVEIMIRE